VEDDGETKYTHLQMFVKKHDIDILALLECSMNWGEMEYKYRLPEHTKGWWESVQWATAYNKLEEHPSTHQPGGMALALLNTMMHRAQRLGNDIFGLRQWCWGRLQGKDNIITWVVSIYRPCFSTGPMSTYQQQDNQTISFRFVPGQGLWWSFWRRSKNGGLPENSWWLWVILMMIHPKRHSSGDSKNWV